MPDLFKAWTQVHEARTNLQLAEKHIAEGWYLEAEVSLADAERYLQSVESESEGLVGQTIRSSLVSLSENIEQTKSTLKDERLAALSRSASA